MRGFPKALNTKVDYDYVRQNFPKEFWVPQWQALLDTRKDWFFERYLDEGEAVTPDATIKVIEPQENSSEKRRSLYVLKDNPTSKLSKLGFTVEEVQAAIAGA